MEQNNSSDNNEDERSDKEMTTLYEEITEIEDYGESVDFSTKLE